MREKPVLLVADQDKDIRFLIRMYMRDYDLEFIEARDGQECLELARKSAPSLMIVNYMLDKINGYQIAEQVSADEGLKGTPLIIMTLEGFDLFEEKEGVADYLAKPFTRKQLQDVVAKAAGDRIYNQKEKEEKADRPVLSSEASSEEKKKTGKKKILIADDEPNIIKLLQLILNKEFNVDAATTGEELVEKVQQSEYDLIISDVIMPKLSGWKSIKKVRELGFNTPVIFNSGLVKDKELYETLKPVGPSMFILKPFEKEKLLSAVKQLLE